MLTFFTVLKAITQYNTLWKVLKRYHMFTAFWIKNSLQRTSEHNHKYGNRKFLPRKFPPLCSPSVFPSQEVSPP